MWHEHNKLLSTKIIGTSWPRPAAESDDLLPGGDLFDIIKQRGPKGIVYFIHQADFFKKILGGKLMCKIQRIGDHNK